MDQRTRFLKTFRFQQVDRPFRWETPGVWAATAGRWFQEGLDEKARGRITAYFGMDKVEWLKFPGGWTKNPYCPMFEKKEIERDDQNVTALDNDGIIKKQRIVNPETSMPQFLKFPVENKNDYIEKIKPRMTWDHPQRFSNDWQQQCKTHLDRTHPLGLFIIGPFGFIRNLMGDENLMYMMYDHPELIQEMMEDWQNFYIPFIQKVCKGVVPDFVMIWEDICYNRGPLISPQQFQSFLQPHLKKVVQCIKENEIEGIIVDTDGDCTKMLPIYLECGVNGFYPFEVQAGMDIVALRKQYPDEFVIIGGLDKTTLAKNKKDIIKELETKVPFMLEQKGYIPMLDHTVPPDVPLENFVFFLEYIRDMTK